MAIPGGRDWPITYRGQLRRHFTVYQFRGAAVICRQAVPFTTSQVVRYRVTVAIYAINVAATVVNAGYIAATGSAPIGTASISRRAARSPTKPLVPSAAALSLNSAAAVVNYGLVASEQIAVSLLYGGSASPTRAAARSAVRRDLGAAAPRSGECRQYRAHGSGGGFVAAGGSVTNQSGGTISGS